MTFNQQYIRQLDTFEYSLSSDDFDLQQWINRPGVSLLQGGRGGSLKIEILQQPLVLHHYLRGGMMARVLRDRYVWSGLSRTRPFMEEQVVQHAVRMALPVPEMLGFYVQRQGLFYRAASISRYIQNQGSLAEFIAAKPLAEKHWGDLGALIKKMHQAQICHVDLNANNILIDEKEAFYLIDFDKARVVRRPGRWSTHNLERLLRSLNKIHRQHQQQGLDFHFQENDWQALLAGYK